MVQDAELDGIAKRIQHFLQDVPLAVLGSGASINYGIPSMAELVKDTEKIDADSEGYKRLIALLSAGTNLEDAMSKADLDTTTFTLVKETIWKSVCEKDHEYFWRDGKCEPTTKLLAKLLDTCNHECMVITTNYDRIIEYAVDQLMANACLGFEGNLTKSFDNPSNETRIRRIRARNKTVYIWKVHGSLDWFKKFQDNTIVSYPLRMTIPENHEPLIVPPGKEKLALTHEEPFRSIIHKADQAIDDAPAFLCVGYGFNDEHIQPKIITQICRGKPIVVLARTLSQNCRDLIVNNENVTNYAVFERHQEGTTKVTINNTETVIPDNYWDLSNFMELW